MIDDIAPGADRENAFQPADTLSGDIPLPTAPSGQVNQDAPASETPPEPEEESDEEWARRFVDENAHLAPPPLVRPPAPPPQPWDGPRSQWKVPDHLSMPHPNGGYMAMALLSRTMDDLDEVTGGKRAATYEEVDKYFGLALIAEGLVPFTYTADEAIRWWKAGGYRVLGRTTEDPVATAPAINEDGLMPPPDFSGAASAIDRGPGRTVKVAGPGLAPSSATLMKKASFLAAGRQLGAGSNSYDGPDLPSPLEIIGDALERGRDSAVEKIREGLAALEKTGAGLAARATAYFVVTGAINSPFTTPTATRLLTEWRDGTSKTTRANPDVFDWDSDASHELMFGTTGEYYRDITRRGFAQLAAAGKLKEGGRVDIKGIPPYDPVTGSNGLMDGINVGDAVGTMTYGVTAEVKGLYVYFTGENAMSLGSFSGENLLRHGQVDNPTRGSFSTTYQRFIWRVPLP